MESASRILRYLFATLTVVSACQVASAQTALPPDAENRCPIEGGAVRSWFASANVTEDGIVKAPNNLVLPTNQNICGFFERSAQMFLWLTSPPPPAYGGGSRVFNSPLFYQVLRDQDPKFRVLRPMSPEAPRSLDLNLPQLGPGNIPFFSFFFDDKGEMLTIVRPESGPNSKPVIQNKSGDAIEIEHTQIQKDGKLIFLDKDGKPIFLDKDRKIFLDKDGKPIFLDKDGKPIETEVGQLNQAVLMARDDRLVYYMVQVNDVFAYFRTGAKNDSITPAPTRFPSSESELESIRRFAEAHAKRFLEPNVLTVTLKSAWVETAGFSPDERRKYLTMTATIPQYEKASDNKKWVLNGTKSAELALVGMHVVFGLVGHPEKIWATFEHANNTPHDTYFYLGKDENRMTAPRPAGGTWLFSTNSAAPDVNRRRMVLRDDGSIEVEDPSQAIGPSNLLRINPWGVPGGKDAARDNTSVISFNRNLIEQLHPNDVRRNYLLIGSTWTVANGVPPHHQDGTSIAANTTMESFHQHVPHGCFGCHQGAPSMLGLPDGEGGLSRIWGRIKPLFSAQ